MTACLLFLILIIGDETTVFLRFCLNTLDRYSLRSQPLFLFVQLSTLALSVLLPSAVTVVFWTFLIDRFVAAVEGECLDMDQRYSTRIGPGRSSDVFLEDVAGTKRQITSKDGRVARSVSLFGDNGEMTGRSDASASGSSSIVRQYRMHPDWQRDLDEKEVSLSDPF